MDTATEAIREKLFALKDDGYKAFHSKLMPDVDPERIIGIQIPKLRRIAKELRNTPEAEFFLNQLPHKYYEENNLHAFLIEQIKDFDSCVKAVNKFLPYIDNWATCDSLRPKVFKKNLFQLKKQSFEWIDSGDTFSVRYGIECLMLYFLDDNFSIEHARKIAAVDCSEYYVSTMVAWYFATALAKQSKAIMPFFENKLLDPVTHKRAVRKAIESYRINDVTKSRLKQLK